MTVSTGTNNYPVATPPPTVGEAMVELASAIDGLTDAILVVGTARLSKKELDKAIAKASKHTNRKDRS